MNIKRILFAVLMVTVFLIPLTAGLVASAVATSCVVGYRMGDQLFRWLVLPKARP